MLNSEICQGFGRSLLDTEYDRREFIATEKGEAVLNIAHDYVSYLFLCCVFVYRCLKSLSVR